MAKRASELNSNKIRKNLMEKMLPEKSGYILPISKLIKF